MPHPPRRPGRADVDVSPDGIGVIMLAGILDKPTV
jgi:hypothetical protein